MPILKPKLLTTLKGYTREQFAADAVAGLIVGFTSGIALNRARKLLHLPDVQRPVPFVPTVRRETPPAA